MRIRLVAILLAAPLISAGASAELVLIPVTVIDGKGATVTGLERRHFKLTQDNVQQNIVSFTRQYVPCSVGVIVDTSGNMLHRLDAAKVMIRAFLDTAAPRDEASLMKVSSHSQVESGFTQGGVEIQNSLRLVRPGGSAALLDTLYQALNRMHSAHNPRRALLVISDGMDNRSRYSKGDLMRIAMDADVQIYTISMGGPAQVQEEHRALTLLEDLADKTGGLHYTVDLPNAAKQVGLAVRNQYVIGYRPADAEQPGKWHKIGVKLDVPDTSVYARNGYYSR